MGQNNFADSEVEGDLGIVAPASTWRNAIAICSSENLLYFMPPSWVRGLQRRKSFQFWLVQFFGRRSTAS